MKYIKVFICSVIFSVLCIGGVEAEVITTPRNEDNNYCVNKDIKITDDNLDNIKETPCVDATELVYDFADTLDKDSLDDLKERAREFQDKTDMSLVIYTYDADVSYEYNEVLGADFYDYNDFALNLDDSYSGILLLRNRNEDRRYFMVMAFGEAQFYYDEYRQNKILDEIESDIVSDNYYAAFVKFIDASLDFYEEGKWEEADLYYLDDAGFIVKRYRVPIGGILIATVIITAVIVGALLSKHKMIRKATHARQYIDAGDTNISLRDQKLTSSHTRKIVMSNNSSSGGGGRSRSGSSGRGHSSSGRRG